MVRETSSKEISYLRALSIPALICIFTIVFINPATGILFSIDDSHRFIMGPSSIALQLCNLFYLVAASAIVVKNHRRIDAYKKHSIWLMIGMGAAAIVMQAIYGSIRITVFAFTFITLEMYLSYQIPENRFDALTGLLSRRAFYEATEKMLRHHPDTDYLLVYTNVKEFKAVNEIMGTHRGDQILAGIARGIERYAGSEGTAGRMQSDHFALCVPVQNFDREEFLSETSHERLQSLLGCEIHLIFGTCKIDDHEQSVETVCDHARLAMNRIESSRTTRVAEYCPQFGESFLADHAITGEMENSLKHGDFEVYLQPIIDLSTFQLASAEALVRWNHPTRGFLTPDSFLPLFERNGLVTQLDSYVWDSVCTLQRTWIDKGMPHVPISVNISRADIEAGLGDRIRAKVEGHGIPHDCIRFEITESAYVEDQEPLRLLIDQLHAAGFTVLLDDFGSGYSSLSVLEDAPFDNMKIDREFLLDVFENSRSRTVLDTTITLANSLSIPVITEGVETLDQAMLLREMGSQYAQGFYFNRPMPVRDFEELLLKRA